MKVVQINTIDFNDKDEIEHLILERNSLIQMNDKLNKTHLEYLKEIQEMKHENKMLIVENLSILSSHKEIIDTIRAAETHRQKHIVSSAYLKTLDDKIKKTYNKLIDLCSPLPF